MIKDDNIKFLYQFQTMAVMVFNENIESVWMEEQEDVVEIILNEVLRKLEFILENGLLMRQPSLGISDEWYIFMTHFLGIFKNILMGLTR